VNGHDRPNKPALLVVGHGTRHPRGRSQFMEIIQSARQRLPDTVVRHACLEQSPPNVVTALRELAQNGVDRVVLVPLLLFESGHWRRDLPALMDQARRHHSNLRVARTRALATHPQIAQLAAARIAQTGGRIMPTPEQTLLLVVGRGSVGGQTDPACRDLGRRIAGILCIDALEVAFMGMSQPLLPDVLEKIGTKPFQWVYVSPLLLFDGELVDRLYRTIREQEIRSVRQRFYVGAPLGTDSTLVDAVLDRYRKVYESRAR